MVAMREDFNSERRAAKPSTRERAVSMSNKDKVDMVLARCIQEVTHNLLKTLGNEQEKLMLLSAEAWRLIIMNALFSVVKVANFHDTNREGEKDIVSKRIRRYESFADEHLGDDFVETCKALNNWRDDAAQDA